MREITCITGWFCYLGPVGINALLFADGDNEGTPYSVDTSYCDMAGFPIWEEGKSDTEHQVSIIGAVYAEQKHISAAIISKKKPVEAGI